MEYIIQFAAIDIPNEFATIDTPHMEYIIAISKRSDNISIGRASENIARISRNYSTCSDIPHFYLTSFTYTKSDARIPIRCPQKVMCNPLRFRYLKGMQK